jgi:hypothetical protein
MEDVLEQAAKIQEQILQGSGTPPPPDNNNSGTPPPPPDNSQGANNPPPPPDDKSIKVDWDVFNKETGFSFKSADEIKALNEKASKLEEIEKELSGLKPKISEYEQKLIDAENPLKHFASNEDYIEYQLRKQYPDQKHLISQIMDVKNADDIDVLKLEMKFDNPKGREAGVKGYLDKHYGVNIDDKEEWDEATAFQISVDAKKAREKLSGKIAEVKLPTVDTEKQKQLQEQKDSTIKANKEKWAGYVNRPEFIEKAFDELKFQDEKDTEPYYVHKVDPEFKKQLPSIVLKIAEANQLELNQKNFTDIMEAVTDQYWKVNRHKMNKAMIDAHKAQWEVEMNKKIHNPANLNRQDAGAGQTTVDPMVEYLKEWGAEHKVKV